MKFPVEKIVVPADRQREKAEADNTLITSVEKHGLINPIVIREDGTLVAGQRRLDAHLKLKLEEIEVTIFENLSPVDQYEIELLENIARKNLSWQEEVRAVATYHQMRMEASKGIWTQLGTANALGYSDTLISKYLIIAEELSDEDVVACPTLTGAYNLLVARADRARIAAQSRGLAIAGAVATTLPPPLPIGATPAERTAALLATVNLEKNVNETIDKVDQSLEAIRQGKIAVAALEEQKKLEVVNDLVLNANFLDWAVEYSGPRFDVIHCDFPYGKNYKGAGTRKTGPSHIAPLYADNPDIFLGLVEGFLNLQDRFVQPSAHCLFWYDMSYHAWTVEQFEAKGWSLVQPYPYIWTKGYQGIASDVKRRPRHCYEACLLFVRGDRKIVKLDKDWFDASVDEKLHLNQKPHAMLKHLLSIFVDEHTAVLDPTCGSGSALVAAAQNKAYRFLGIELDSNNADIARYLLQRYNAKPSEEEAA